MVWKGLRVAKSRTRLSGFTFPFHFHALEKEMATNSSVLAWRIPGMGEPGGLPSMGSHRIRRLSGFTFPFHFHALEKEMATHSSVLAWRIPGWSILGKQKSKGLIVSMPPAVSLWSAGEVVGSSAASSGALGILPYQQSEGEAIKTM